VFDVSKTDPAWWLGEPICKPSNQAGAGHMLPYAASLCLAPGHRIGPFDRGPGFRPGLVPLPKSRDRQSPVGAGTLCPGSPPPDPGICSDGSFTLCTMRRRFVHWGSVGSWAMVRVPRGDADGTAATMFWPGSAVRRGPGCVRMTAASRSTTPASPMTTCVTPPPPPRRHSHNP